MKKYLIPVLLLSFASLASVAYAAPSFIYQRTILPETSSTYELGTTTKKWLRLFTDYASTTAITSTTICLTGDSCRTTWPSSSGGGTGNVATSSQETSTYIPFWSSTNATPATLSGGESTFTYDSAGNKLTVSYASTTGLTSDYASTSNLRVSLGTTFEFLTTGLLKVTSGAVGLATAGVDYVASYDAWTHPVAGTSATTSQIRMAGLISTASSTIDAGLTITGTASTTGTLRALGPVDQAALNMDRLDLGVQAGTPRMIFENAGNTIWQIDNEGGTFRWFVPGSEVMNLQALGAFNTSAIVTLKDDGATEIVHSTVGNSYYNTGFNLGVGTTVPSSLFSVGGASAGIPGIQMNATGQALIPYASTTAISSSGTSTLAALGIGSSTPFTLLSVLGGPYENTAYFYNDAPSGRTRVTIRGGAGENSTPVLNIIDSSGAQQAYIRNDGYIAGTVVGTQNDSTVVLTQNSTSDEKPGVDMANTSQVTWANNGFWWGPKDLGIGRNAEGRLEVNSGTLGTLRDLSVRHASSTALTVDGSGASFVVSNAGANIGLATSTQPSSKVELGGTQVTNGGDNGTGQFLNLSGLLSFNSGADQGSVIKVQPTVTNSGASNIFYGINVDPRTITNTSQISNYISYRAAEETTNTFGTTSIGFLYGNAPGGTTDYGFYSNSADANYFGGSTYLANNAFLGWLNSGGSLRTIMSLNTGNGVDLKTADALYVRVLNSTGAREMLRIDETGGVSLGIGTATPRWALQIASTTATDGRKPALALTDMGAGTNLKHWTVSSQGGNFYVATATDSFATSTVPAFRIGTNGSSTFANGIDITTGCYSVNGACLAGSTAFVQTSDGVRNVTGNIITYNDMVAMGGDFNKSTTSTLILNSTLSNGANGNTTAFDAGTAEIANGGDTNSGSGAGTPGNAGAVCIGCGGDNNRATGPGGNGGAVTLAAGGQAGDTGGADGSVTIGSTNFSNSTVTIYGTQTISGNISSTGNGTGLTSGTSDGSDNKYVTFNGAGSNDATRGGSISAFGNEFSTFGLNGSVALKAGSENSNSRVLFQTGPSSDTRVSINYDGKFGVGTVTPNWLFQVSSTTAGSGSTKPMIAISDQGAGANLKHWTISSQGGQFYFATSSDALATSTNAVVEINKSGNVFMRALALNTSGVSASVCLDSNNQLTRNTDNETCLSSSITTKKQINKLTNNLDTLRKLSTVSFIYKDDKDNIKRYGFIAEQVAKINPDLVSYNGDKPSGIHWSHITTLLVQGFQNHDKRIDKLEQENKELKSRLEKLEAKIK